VCKIKFISDYLHRYQRTGVVNQRQRWGRENWAQTGQWDLNVLKMVTSTGQEQGEANKNMKLF
jgi:hypothetical protein